MTGAELVRIVRVVIGDYRFERTYPASVVQTNADGTVDILPDDLDMRGFGLQRVQIATIAPNTTVYAEPGARCLLAFDAGDSRKPVVVAWESAPDKATVGFDGGSASVARKGDLVDVFLSAASPIAGVVSGSVTTPGSPPTVTPVPPGTQFSGVAMVVAPVRGTIIGGAPMVKA